MMTGIVVESVGVRAPGVVSAQTLKAEILAPGVYVHSSYIENDCISVSEARMLGAAVIACYVGGNHSTIEHNVSGILVPSDEPHTLASWIGELYSDRELAKSIGIAGRVHALGRHNPEMVERQVLDAYNKATH